MEPKTEIQVFRFQINNSIPHSFLQARRRPPTFSKRPTYSQRKQIIRITLGSKLSILTDLINSESGIEPTTDRRDWLSTRYLVSLNQNPANLTYESVKSLHDSNELWPPRCSPSLKTVSANIKNQGIRLFHLPAGVTDQTNKKSAPLAPIKWFPIPKNEAATNHQAVSDLFDILLTNIQAPSTHIYTDGSVTKKLQLLRLHMESSVHYLRIRLSSSGYPPIHGHENNRKYPATTAQVYQTHFTIYPVHFTSIGSNIQ